MEFDSSSGDSNDDQGTKLELVANNGDVIFTFVSMATSGFKSLPKF